MTQARQQAEALVLEFAKAWERCDVDAILQMVTPDVVYQNVPVPEMHGKDAMRAFMTPTLSALKSMTWEFRANLADPEGRQVLTERVDIFHFPEGDVSVPLMGIFILRDGLIAEWRDYADMGAFLQQMQAIGRAPNPGLKLG